LPTDAYPPGVAAVTIRSSRRFERTQFPVNSGTAIATVHTESDKSRWRPGGCDRGWRNDWFSQVVREFDDDLGRLPTWSKLFVAVENFHAKCQRDQRLTGFGQQAQLLLRTLDKAQLLDSQVTLVDSDTVSGDQPPITSGRLFYRRPEVDTDTSGLLVPLLKIVNPDPPRFGDAAAPELAPRIELTLDPTALLTNGRTALVIPPGLRWVRWSFTLGSSNFNAVTVDKDAGVSEHVTDRVALDFATDSGPGLDDDGKDGSVKHSRTHTVRQRTTLPH
jgi:hypothetical protein